MPARANKPNQLYRSGPHNGLFRRGDVRFLDNIQAARFRAASTERQHPSSFQANLPMQSGHRPARLRNLIYSFGQYILRVPRSQLKIDVTKKYSCNVAFMKIGDRIKKMREEAGMTMDQLGDKMRVGTKKETGFTKQAVSAWESGRNELTSEQIKMLCQLFHVTADYLIFGTKHEYSSETVKFANKYEKLTPEQRKQFDHIYMLVRQPASDSRVQDSFGNTPGTNKNNKD